MLLTGPHVTRLMVSDFRCYGQAALEVDPRPVVLTGPNGAGKTNLLEALSFLAPGRGLRQARLGEVDRAATGARGGSAAAGAWAVAAASRRARMAMRASAPGATRPPKKTPANGACCRSTAPPSAA